VHIDPFVLVAQVVNFLLLLWFLRVVLFDRVLRIMEERERMHMAERAAAEAVRKEARDAAENFDRKRRELEEGAAAFLDDARRDAEAKRREGLAAAREEAEESREKWRELLRRERTVMLGEFRRRATRHLYEAARRAFADLADTPVEQQMVRAFIRRLDALPEDSRADLSRASAGPAATALVRSAFALAPGLRAELDAALRRHLGDAIGVSYESSPDLIAGIEARVSGFTVAWHLEDYLETLAALMDNVFREQVDHA
jgi:F-type H+-transporting ATPase subunit b